MRAFEAASGDLIVTDPTVPFATKAARNYDMDIWVFPRTLIDPHLAPRDRPRLLHIANRTGVDGMVHAYLDAFAQQIDTLNDADAGLISDNFCRLLAVACGGAAADDHREAVRAARLEEAKRHIALHLADPDLTPATAAIALKVSVRQLHQLFEPTDTSFAEYVLRRRLEECRAALTSIGAAERAVTDIAFAWGFNSLATFYRSFRATFGMTPSELRAAALADAPRVRPG